MSTEKVIIDGVISAVAELFNAEIKASDVQLQNTRKEFEGDVTVVVFPFLRYAKLSPEATGEKIGAYLKENIGSVTAHNTIKGFLNISISQSVWLDTLNAIIANDKFGITPVTADAPLAMVEYSSPNTNKPLHLGHIRNNLLGYSVSEILKANGKNVVKTNIVNDRGIHICKSMLAWQKFGKGETPESSGKKGDHLVGEYYVKFDKEYKKELAELMNGGATKEEAEAQSQLMNEAREMLRKWEAEDAEVIALWETMNNWVYKGFDATYKQLGVDFDKIYYESETYKVGRDEALRGLKEGTLYQRDDNSVWANLEADGLDEKILLRSDGTSVYMTQDIGTAKMRFDDYKIDEMIYVVGNEQNYHFQVLSIVLDKLGYSWGKDLVHFSYGMVELPEGKMKSREGTVVDADDLVQEMIDAARETSKELGKLDGYSDEEAEKVYRMIALGALKYFILKVDPRKTMLFDPKDSIDFNGNTGPFIQYTYARIQSVLRKAAAVGVDYNTKLDPSLQLSTKESYMIQVINRLPEVIKDAGKTLSPALIANFVYELVKEYNQFYHDCPILKEENQGLKQFRVSLSYATGLAIKNGLQLLGIDVPERM